MHPHHFIFRSHGGTDALNNLLTLCSCCHLEGVHQGNLYIEFVNRTANNVLVRFLRKKGWKPT